MTLFGEVNSGDGNHILLGARTGSGFRELHVNQEKVSKWSELAIKLPVLEIHPESYILIMGGPAERRKFLNWGMFHVEPSYARLWSEYTRAIKQRNSCLRFKQIEQARYWNKSLAEHGESIAHYLTKYTKDIAPIIGEISSLFSISDELSLSYYPGWDQDIQLETLLKNELVGEEIPGSTQYGPHRGDLRITWQNKPFSKVSSRGQQKALSIAFKLAQARLLKNESGKSSIYLIDELPAELDSQSRETALKLLDQLNAQVIITAVSKESVDYINNDIKWFHVERGYVTAMV